MAWQRVGHLASVVDDHRVAGVGGADEGPFELQRTQARDVAVLVDGEGVAKPADVADVDKHGGRLCRVDETRAQLFAKQVFVTNVRRQALALPLKRRLPHGAPVEISQRDVHHLREPFEERRNELAERHQVVFVVAVSAGQFG